MSSSRRVIKNTGILMGMELGIRLMDAVVAVLLARYLGPADFGLMAFALSFAWLFSILPGFGMGAMATRDTAQDAGKIGRYVSNGILAKTFLAGATFLLLAVVARVLGFDPTKSAAVMLAGLLMVIETNIRFLVSFFQGAQKMGTVAGVNLSVRAGWIAGSLFVMALGGTVTHLLGIRVIVAGTGLLASLFLIHTRLQKISWGFDLPSAFRMAKASIPFALFRLHGQLYMDIDTVMVSALRGDVMCGWYAAAQKFLKILTFIPNSFSNALLPALSRSGRESGPAAVADTLGKGCRYLAVMGLGIAGTVFAISDPLVLLLLGPAFREAAPALRILIWAVPFSFINGSLLAATAAVNREKQASWCLIAGALFSSLSNLAVVPLWGHLGAAATTMFAEAAICFLQLRVVRGAVPGFSMLQGRALHLSAALAGLLGTGWLLRGTHPVVAAAGGLAAYAAILLMTGGVSSDDRRMIREMLTRRKGPPPFGEASLPADLTVHCRVRNEERFVRQAIESVLPLAKKVLVYDTGSTDRTLEEVSAIPSDKIEIVRRPSADAKGLLAYRNEMIERTDTEWFMLVDGDEVYPDGAADRIARELASVPAGIHRIVIGRKHFIGSFNFVSGMNGVGRIFRTREIRHRVYSPKFENRVGHETPYLQGNPAAPAPSFSMRMPPDIFFFHCHHLRRSSRDEELGRMRRWRSVPLPVRPYLGPWPAGLRVNGAARRMSLAMTAGCVRLNTTFAALRLLRLPQALAGGKG